MPRTKSFSLVTVMRDAEGVRSVDVSEELTREELIVRLTAPPPTDIDVARHVFAGAPIEWSPSVQLGAPRAKKNKKAAASAPKPTTKPKPANGGTRFDDNLQPAQKE